jgi:hypothetical protein
MAFNGFWSSTRLFDLYCFKIEFSSNYKINTKIDDLYAAPVCSLETLQAYPTYLVTALIIIILRKDNTLSVPQLDLDKWKTP